MHFIQSNVNQLHSYDFLNNFLVLLFVFRDKTHKFNRWFRKFSHDQHFIIFFLSLALENVAKNSQPNR